MERIEWKAGMKVAHRGQPTWGIGHVVHLRESGRFLAVRFPGRRDGAIYLSARDKDLGRASFAAGQLVVLKAEGEAIPVEVAELKANKKGLHAYVVKLKGIPLPVSEGELEAMPPEPGALSALSRGEWEPPPTFVLRTEAVTLDLQRRGDTLGALFASRVMVKPWQVSVVHRVLAGHAPRFLLADEVGLGKTIEAGMVASAMAQNGLGKRIVVVAPSHLALQWLAELRRKFNLRFALLDGERFEEARQAEPERDPFLSRDRIVTTLDVLTRSEEALAALESEGGRPDLVIFDEAHHLASPKAFEVASRLAKASWGCLFLTATPLALDRGEYFRLLQLLEPSAARDEKDFEKRLERAGEVAQLSRGLLAGGKAAKEALATLEKRFAADEALLPLLEAAKKKASAMPAVLDHLAEGYTLSTRMLRNRRGAVGGFPSRKPVLHDLTPSKAEASFLAAAREAVFAGLQSGAIAKGAVGGALLRRIESSPAAAARALRGAGMEALAEQAAKLEGAEGDSRYRALRALVKGLGAKEKVLVFTESRETLSMLASLLERDGLVAAQYHGDLSALDRDRQVARFRSEEGPQLMLSTELGGEGRNFQFARHLVHYDLPWSPSVVEQRNGRIDRVGQLRDMQLHVLRMPGSLGAEVATLMDEAVGVLRAPVGGLDPVLDGVEEAIAQLASEGPSADWKGYRTKLAAQLADARKAMDEEQDPLLDRRSLDLAGLTALVRRGAARLGAEEDLPESFAADAEEPPTFEEVEEGLSLLSRELDERLEDVVCRLARQAGIGVDTDEQVEAFECAFTLGKEMKVEALPGMDLNLELETLHGSFWRDTAVEREELESFTSGHRLVEALLGLARDGHHGRATFRRFSARERDKAIGFQFRFLLEPPQSEDLAAGVRVPSRVVARHLPRPAIDLVVTLEPGGGVKVRDDLAERLFDPDAGGHGIRGDDVPTDKLPVWVKQAHEGALAEAQRRLAADLVLARKRLDAEWDASLARLALRRGKAGLTAAEKKGIAAEEEELEQWFERVGKALGNVRLELDSAAGFLLG